jgi:hypothetical protein
LFSSSSAFKKGRLKMSDIKQRPEGYEWVRWLTGEDAQLLAWQLFQWIEDPTITREGLITRIRALQRNAHKVVMTNSWHMRLDNSLGVCVSEWMYLFEKRLRAWEAPSLSARPHGKAERSPDSSGGENSSNVPSPLSLPQRD